MTQLMLYAPDITCDHCVATIARTVDVHQGARFLAGDVPGKRFTIEIDAGSILDALAEALNQEGYPLGPAELERDTVDPAQAVNASWRPAYRVTPTDAGAEVNYDCPCGCVAGFAFNRAVAAAEPESCCCGREILVGRGAEERLRAAVAGHPYDFDVQGVTMPWGQPMDVALAIPAESAAPDESD